MSVNFHIEWTLTPFPYHEYQRRDTDQVVFSFGEKCPDHEELPNTSTLAAEVSRMDYLQMLKLIEVPPQVYNTMREDQKMQ